MQLFPESLSQIGIELTNPNHLCFVVQEGYPRASCSVSAPPLTYSMCLSQSFLYLLQIMFHRDMSCPLYLSPWHLKNTYFERHSRIIILWNLPRQQYCSLHNCFDMKIFCKHCWKRKNCVFKLFLKHITCSFTPWITVLKTDTAYIERREKCDLPTCLEHSLIPILIKHSPLSPVQPTILCLSYLRT